MKKIYLIIITVLICSFAVCGALAAAEWYREDRTTNTISVGNLSAEIVDVYVQDTVVMPGDTVEKIVSVRNNGKSDEIVRVRLTGMWTDNGEFIKPEHLACETNAEDWLFDEDTGFYYYKAVLSPGEVSAPLLRSFSVDGPGINNYYSGRPGVITVAMDAVQAAAGGASVWGKTNDELYIEYDERPEYGEESESGVEFRGAQDGFDFGENGDLFASFKNLLPGQTVIQNISVGNSNKEGTEIFLRAECNSEENNELLYRLLTGYTEVDVKAGGKTVYSGPLWNTDEQGQLLRGQASDSLGEDALSDAMDELYKNGISLGTVNADLGTQVTVELRLSPDAGNEFQDLIGDVDWIFYAKGSDREPVPQTGDNDISVFFVYMIIAGSACLLLILIRVAVSASGRRKASEDSIKVKNKSGYGAIPVIAAAAFTVVIAAALFVSGTLAFMTDTETANNEIKAGTLSIDLTEPGYTPGVVLGTETAVPKDPTVTNTGTVPMLAYLRVGIPIRNVATVDGDTKMIIPAKEQELFSFDPDDRWVMIEKRIETDADGCKYAVYIYGFLEKPLEPGEVSAPLFDEIMFVNILEGELKLGTKLEVPISAFGLQSSHINEGGSMEERLVYGYENYVKGAWT